MACACGREALAKQQNARPIEASERILALDVFRGFAMLGVLVAYCMWSLGTAPEASWSRADEDLATLVHLAVDGKFYTILAFLFGLGFSIQLSRREDRTAVETYCRRLAVLAGIGLAHALLLRNGDILLPYALTGFLLIPLRRASDRALLLAALAALLLGHGIQLLWEISGAPPPQRPHLENAPYLVENAEWVRYWYRIAPFNWPLNLTLFLFGFLAGRHRLIGQLSQRSRTLAAILACGLMVGGALYFAEAEFSKSADSPVARSAAIMLFTVHCWGMSSAYAAALLLMLERQSGARLLKPLSAIGRMALTNYLMQAGLIVPLCLAFGWFDTFTPSTSLALAIALFVLVQLPFSRWWLKHYQFGPAEWFWRLLTYGRAPPMKVASKDYAPI